jgi:hypothetical protein
MLSQPMTKVFVHTSGPDAAHSISRSIGEIPIMRLEETHTQNIPHFFEWTLSRAIRLSYRVHCPNWSLYPRRRQLPQPPPRPVVLSGAVNHLDSVISAGASLWGSKSLIERRQGLEIRPWASSA